MPTWQALMLSLVMLCLAARKLATLADQVRADRARLRAEAARWRAEQARHTLTPRDPAASE
ncbi:MAG TPA: hypothetical protein VGG08_03720 [Solirubrobacteraceae bacterium]